MRGLTALRIRSQGKSACSKKPALLGELVKQGWKPKRTIVYCAWDGEEEGLLGSTEWVETHADELQQKGVVYINSDSNGRGYMYVGGSHTLEKFINAVMRDINDPEKNISILETLVPPAGTPRAISADDRREMRTHEV